MTHRVLKPEVQWRRDKWVEALESEEYDQCIDNLRGKDGYCCLGVACDVYRKLTGEGHWQKVLLHSTEIYTFKVGESERTGELPPEVAEFFDVTAAGRVEESVELDTEDLENVTQPSLADYNDNGVTFAKIAWLLKNHPDELEPFDENEEAWERQQLETTSE